MIGVIVMLNNYFHDLASGLLLCSAVIMFALLKGLKDNPSAESLNLYLFIYKKMSWFARFSLVWIILGGVIRVIAYRTYEWSDAAGRGQIPALVGKHIFFTILIAAGVFFWMKLKSRVDELSGEGGAGKA